MKILHILNFFKGSENDDLVQSRTMQSLCVAARFAKRFGVDIEFVFVGDKADISFAETNFSRYSEDIKNSSLIIQASLPYPFLHGRSNPSLTEAFFCTPIKELIQEAMPSDAGCLIVLSNTDICLRPHAYLGVFLLHKKNTSASFAINRETLPVEYLQRPLEDAYALSGTVHPGHDFFCIPPRIYVDVDLEPNGHIIGFGFVMRPLLANLIVSSSPFWEIGYSRLTFHYGDDMPWKNAKWEEAISHNKTNMISVYRRLHAKHYSRLPKLKKDMLGRFFPTSLVGSPHD